MFLAVVLKPETVALQTLKCLNSFGGSLSLVDDDGQGVEFYAAMNGYCEVLSWIFDVAGMDCIGRTNKYQQTILFTAASAGK